MTMSLIAREVDNLAQVAAGNPFIAPSFAIAGAVLGAVLAHLLRRSTVGDERRFQLQSDLIRARQEVQGEFLKWRREELRSASSRFLAAVDDIFNLAVSAKLEAPGRVAEEARRAIEAAAQRATTVGWEVKLIVSEEVANLADQLLRSHIALADEKLNTAQTATGTRQAAVSLTEQFAGMVAAELRDMTMPIDLGDRPG